MRFWVLNVDKLWKLNLLTWPNPSSLVQQVEQGVLVEAFHLTESVYKVFLQDSVPAQIRQLVLYILYISNGKG
jgi:hypothetical protein